MVSIAATDDERNLVALSLVEFASYAGVDSTFDLKSLPTIRRLQVEHCRWQGIKLDPRADCSLSVLSLGIVEEACWELPVAIETENGEEVFDALGDVLIFTCGVCTELRLDFMTLSRNFDADHLTPVDGLDGIMNLFKAIGMLAHVVVHHRQLRRGYESIDQTRLDAGAAIARLCSAVHWLAFSNDWDAATLFQGVIEPMMAKRDWFVNAQTGEPVVKTPLNVDGVDVQ